MDLRQAEDEVIRARVQVRGRDPEHPVRAFGFDLVEDRVRADLVSLGFTPRRVQGDRVEDRCVAEPLQVFDEVLEDLPRHIADRLEGDPHPFTTPRGTMRATIFVSPAPSATRTTCSTSLYAPGASSTIPAFDAACR